MAALDQLPPDQQAVIGLLVRQGRSYDQVATMLGVDAAAVRRRARQAVSRLGDGPAPAPADLSAISDYLLGQAEESARFSTLLVLTDSDEDRAWARTVAAQLAPIAAHPLPAVPEDPAGAIPTAPTPPTPRRRSTSGEARPGRSADRSDRPRRTPEPTGAAATETVAASAKADARPRRGETDEVADAGAVAAAAETSRRERSRRAERPRRTERPRRERPARTAGSGFSRGTGVLAAAAVLVIVAVVIYLTGLTSPSAPTGPIPASAATASSSAGTSASGTGTSTSSSQVIGQVQLSPPKGSSSSATGAADVVRTASGEALVFSASGLPAPGSGSYVLLLVNAKKQILPLARVNSVSASGSVSASETPLPAKASGYPGIALLLQRSAADGGNEIVLEGASSTGL